MCWSCAKQLTLFCRANATLGSNSHRSNSKTEIASSLMSWLSSLISSWCTFSSLEDRLIHFHDLQHFHSQTQITFYQLNHGVRESSYHICFCCRSALHWSLFRLSATLVAPRPQCCLLFLLYEGKALSLQQLLQYASCDHFHYKSGLWRDVSSFLDQMSTHRTAFMASFRRLIKLPDSS